MRANLEQAMMLIFDKAMLGSTMELFFLIYEARNDVENNCISSMLYVFRIVFKDNFDNSASSER